jgi:hypothetical protein
MGTLNAKMPKMPKSQQASKPASKPARNPATRLRPDPVID